ncbi:MAG: TetR/AcrR family transcriptional regulator [Clostridia bacterium]|nr:TetR/AcrR family transcriptional regulator [Clostridia bacterium]
MREVVTLYSKFENLDEEKKRRIIEVCIDEFSQNDYKNASTNNIVKNAEISKGILFHYFGNKKMLYLYVFDYVADFLTKIMYGRMVGLSTDFFQRAMETGIMKLGVAHEYPAEYRFLINAVTHTPEEVKQEIHERYGKMIQEGMALMFQDIDFSKFKKDIDRDKALEVILFAFEGISNKYFKTFQSKTVDEILAGSEALTKEYEDYIKILQGGVYENM